MMTEKRFRYQRKYAGMIDGRKDYRNCIVDENGNVIIELGFREDAKDVCELLNELVEENEHLQAEIYILQDDILNERVRNLIKENKELKQYINHIHTLYEDTHGINMENEEWWQDD